MATIQLALLGLTCGGCVKKVKEALEQVNGVETVLVELDSAEINGTASTEDLIEAIETAGFEAQIK
ncbi:MULTISPECIES: cation transporter [Nitrincola]|uniref:Copper-exporting P-type ATPase A n=1 Tax=Nitrincola nitratireducens TaxID=1229521 RepID=W9V1D6_9GAMM|nr:MULTISPECIES: cation transporter [Nitrincola]EXJ13144.1 Copper-exporting P-type ATPase A [Nitrincola nitratireducens]